ncbi:hypothetical protein [Micromonospora echinofusca]|uniref:Uncharacterized protein n=1 Tax=Micromonospora echinofusca TaxID=47858 RepID=A0ABS3VXC2_MICEH|nr:hypothetical protein [Micromonospora echinofusca]MBO4209196.1 hypothetical protein [Micromonospora echinofusca]
MRQISSRWRWPWVAGLGVALGVATAIFFRHRFPKLITTEDIAITAAGITLMTALLAFASAKASQSAASESRRALQLHYQPGRIRIEFTARDPENPLVPASSPAPLRISLVFWPGIQSAYEMIWVDDYGRAHAPTHVTPPMQGEVNWDAGWFLLADVSAAEGPGPNNPRLPLGLQMLQIECRDDQLGTKWRAFKSWPAGSEPGVCVLSFEPVDS